MHINFDDESLIVENIQIFLKQEIDPTLVLSGSYDTSTHEALIKYLKQPNTIPYTEMRSKLISNFTYQLSMAPFTLIDGGGIYNFDIQDTPDSLIFHTRPTLASYNYGVGFITDHIEEVDAYARQFGWSVTYYATSVDDGTGSGRTIAKFIVSKTGIKNRFPNKEVLPMINLFTGNYAYKRCFIATDKFEGFIQPHNDYKIAYIKCNPGDTFTIAHGFSIPCEMAAGYVTCNKYQIKHEDTHVYNVKARMTSNGGVVDEGDYFYYEVPENSDATYLLVQMPYKDNLRVSANEKITVKLGDINQDGVIDNQDVAILTAYVTALENNETPPVKLEGNALIAANVTKNVDLDGNPIIDKDDVTVLQKAVESGKTEELGTYEYQKSKTISQFELDRLLVMSGELAKDDNLNIPISDFHINPWAIHSEFIEYFLGRVIHRYSDINDILWLQYNIQQLYPDYRMLKRGVYDCEEDYLTGDYIKFNSASGVWEYFRANTYTGYYMDASSDLKNGVFKRQDKVYVDMKIRDGYIYSNGVADGRIVYDNGVVAEEQALHSLKACVKSFQKRAANTTTLNNESIYDPISWTFGNYDVATDSALMKYLGSDVVNNVGSFR